MNIKDTDYIVTGVQASNVLENWSLVVHFIEASMQYSFDTMTADDILLDLVNRNKQLWVIVDPDYGIVGVIVTQIVQHPRRKVLHIAALAGTGMRKWKNVVYVLEAFGASHGCNGFTGYARPGFSRALKSIGVKTIAHAIGREFNEQALHYV